MKAIVFTRYGPPDVLQLQEKDTPSPKDHEVLVKVLAASVNALEWRPFTMPGFAVRLIGGIREPEDKRFGVDLAGRVEAIGAAVTQFQPGDEVFGVQKGAFAEYVCAAENKLVRKPANVSFAAAAAVPVAAITALQALRDHGHVRPGQHVVVSGAGGGVGTFAVQIAKALGAEVTAVCSTRNMEVARSIGADHVVDYTREDFTRNGTPSDVIVAVNGYHSMRDFRRALKPNGICVIAGGAWGQLIQGLLWGSLLSKFGGKTIRMMLTRPQHDDLVVLKDLLEAGKVVPVIDRSYPLADVAQAVKYLMEGHAQGKVVINI
jgi:NADPH:quinone reductase-like Zn-dependent oxidoreductase